MRSEINTIKFKIKRYSKGLHDRYYSNEFGEHNSRALCQLNQVVFHSMYSIDF